MKTSVLDSFMMFCQDRYFFRNSLLVYICVKVCSLTSNLLLRNVIVWSQKCPSFHKKIAFLNIGF